MRDTPTDIHSMCAAFTYADPPIAFPASVDAEWVQSLAEAMDRASRIGPTALQGVLSASTLLKILSEASDLLKEEATLLELSFRDLHQPTRTVVVGDTHGQYHDVLKMFKLVGPPSPELVYVFNGDYVDRGAWGVELLTLLLCWKLALPSSFYLLRGNHETSTCTFFYGFFAEVKAKYPGPQLKTLQQAFKKLFSLLPLAALIEGCTLVLHGGLFRALPERPSRSSKRKRGKPRQQASASIELGTLDDLRRATKGGKDPSGLGASVVATDVLWSDPVMDAGLRPNDSRGGVGLIFGPDVTEAFLAANGLRLVIRSHEGPDAREGREEMLPMLEGYTRDHQVAGGCLMTVFSAPDYPQFQMTPVRYNNKAAVLLLGPEDFSKPEIIQYEAEQPRPEAKAYYDFETMPGSDEEIELGVTGSDVESVLATPLSCPSEEEGTPSKQGKSPKRGKKTEEGPEAGGKTPPTKGRSLKRGELVDDSVNDAKVTPTKKPRSATKGRTEREGSEVDERKPTPHKARQTPMSREASAHPSGELLMCNEPLSSPTVGRGVVEDAMQLTPGHAGGSSPLSEQVTPTRATRLLMRMRRLQRDSEGTPAPTSPHTAKLSPSLPGQRSLPSGEPGSPKRGQRAGKETQEPGQEPTPALKCRSTLCSVSTVKDILPDQQSSSPRRRERAEEDSSVLTNMDGDVQIKASHSSTGGEICQEANEVAGQKLAAAWKAGSPQDGRVIAATPLQSPRTTSGSGEVHPLHQNSTSAENQGISSRALRLGPEERPKQEDVALTGSTRHVNISHEATMLLCDSHGEEHWVRAHAMQQAGVGTHLNRALPPGVTLRNVPQGVEGSEGLLLTGGTLRYGEGPTAVEGGEGLPTTGGTLRCSEGPAAVEGSEGLPTTGGTLRCGEGPAAVEGSEGLPTTGGTLRCGEGPAAVEGSEGLPTTGGTLRCGEGPAAVEGSEGLPTTGRTLRCGEGPTAVEGSEGPAAVINSSSPCVREGNEPSGKAPTHGGGPRPAELYLHGLRTPENFEGALPTPFVDPADLEIIPPSSALCEGGPIHEPEHKAPVCVDPLGLLMAPDSGV